ncbi:hypothetical protein [Pseudoduganella lurida]|uniref:hypothetical protein n=1 Tax=Pseudoduganella lurida TaxID=1036180 RepID=UPI00131542F4|nr:hypothetical protein [Pseudoduganella lurida]
MFFFLAECFSEEGFYQSLVTYVLPVGHATHAPLSGNAPRRSADLVHALAFPA